MTFVVSLQRVELSESRVTVKYIRPTSKIPLKILRVKKNSISFAKTLFSKDLLPNTYRLLVINAKSTATTHAITVDSTFSIRHIL